MRKPRVCRDIHEGTYYPAVSLFTLPQEAEGATVTCNFGAQQHASPCSSPEALLGRLLEALLVA